MKTILNFGSINIDYVYSVPRFALPGETLSSTGFVRFLGGKGCNQSVAIAKAGGTVAHVGNIGLKDKWILDEIAALGIGTDHIGKLPTETGHAIIQIDPKGENTILLHRGANGRFAEDQIDTAFNAIGGTGIVLLQNEINGVDTIMHKAFERGMDIFFNPAPMDGEVLTYPLHRVRFFIVNETEGSALTGETSPKAILDGITKKFPATSALLTLGSKGALCLHNGNHYEVEAKKADVVDTTAAGDTFIGYFLSEYATGSKIQDCLEIAARAASVTVSRNGGAISIPKRKEL